MSLLALWVASASAWCESTIETETYGPTDFVDWPTASVPVGPDTIVLVSSIGHGPVGAVLLLDPTGVEVAATRIDVVDHLAVFVPDGPLAPGNDYQVVTESEYGPDTFDVVDVPAGVVVPTALPVRRQLYADAVFLDEQCPNDGTTKREVDYRLCDPSAVLLVALVADTEPSAPSSIADLGPVDAVGGGDSIPVVSEALVAGGPATVWIGAFDGDGRFGGWVADALVMPEVGTVRFDEPVDDTGSTTVLPTATPTAFYECPAGPVTWVTTFEQTCESWTQVGLACNESDEVPEDPTSDMGCSCATGPTGAFGGAGLLTLLFVWRRRR